MIGSLTGMGIYDEDDVVKAIVGGRLAAGCACDECGVVRVVHSVESTVWRG